MLAMCLLLEAAKSSTTPLEPIVQFDPAAPQRLFLGPYLLGAIAEPKRLIISVWTLRELGVGMEPVYFVVDLESKTWSRASVDASAP